MAVNLGLVGFCFDIASSDAWTRENVATRWPEFCADSVSDSSEYIRLEAHLEERGIDSIYPPGGVHVEQRGDEWLLARADFEVRWHPATRTARVRFAYGFAPFSSAVRVLLPILLRDARGTLLHASSVRVGDEVILFPGVSGTGKTTVAALGAPRGVLSDEITGLRKHAYGVVVYPTPFWGEMPRVRAAPAGKLRSIVLLERGAPVELTPSHQGDALRALLEGALVFGQPSREEKRHAFHLLSDLTDGITVYRLRYQLPANPWSILDAPSRTSEPSFATGGSSSAS